jgi:hypothetical protein
LARTDDAALGRALLTAQAQSGVDIALSIRAATVPTHRITLQVMCDAQTCSTSNAPQDNGVPSFNTTSGRRLHLALRSSN